MKYDLQFTEKHIISNGIKYDRHLIERIIRLASDPSIKHIVGDGFAGMGGVTAGFKQVPGWMVIFCINHWDVAIDTHQKNHPDCLHLLEDFKIADLEIMSYMVSQIKRNNPAVKFHLWFSFECTNFSGAKGGMSRDPDSRTLAEYADRYIMFLEPDFIWGENVKEFLLWGGMVPKVCIGTGKKKKTLQFNPDSDDAEQYFNAFTENGQYAYCPLVVNKKKQILSKWLIPEKATMGRDFKKWESEICSFGYQSEYRLLNCADYGIPQHRIRLIMQFTPVGVSAKWPKPTHSKHGLNGLPKWKPVRPCLDLHDEGESVLSFVTKKKKLQPRITSAKTVDRLINGVKKHILNGDSNAWLYKHNSAKNNTDVSSGASINSSCPTLTCYGGVKIATAHLIDHYFGNGYTKPIDGPAGTTGTKDGIALYSVDRFLMDTQYNNPSLSIEQPCNTITGSRKYFYLVNFQWFNAGLVDIERPSNTIIARQDKAPNYLIVFSTGEVAIEVFENDPPHYVKLKQFMADNNIVSINMRMLKVKEMLRIMTIPEETKLSRSMTANKKMIGNAVPSYLVTQLALAVDEQEELFLKSA